MPEAEDPGATGRYEPEPPVKIPTTTSPTHGDVPDTKSEKQDDEGPTGISL